MDVPADRKTTRTFAQDEFPRLSTLQQLQALKPAFSAGGSVTAGNASGINDGAAALLLASGRYVKRRVATAGGDRRQRGRRR